MRLLPMMTLVALAACGSKDAKSPTSSPPGAPPPSGPAVDCAGTPCAPPGACVTVSGMTVNSSHQECVIRCEGPAKTCPDGMTCIMINDGPGEVCRPAAPPDPNAPKKSDTDA
nr:hypothetical protein [Kofleriaceae bacterium]